MSKPTRLNMNMQLFAEEVEGEPEVIEEVVEPEEQVVEEVEDLDLNEVRSAMGLKPKEVKEVVESEKEVETEIGEDKPIQPEYVIKFLEEFEGKHNKEVVKPKDVEDLRTNYQKGLNYDKQHDKLSEYEAKVKELEALIGMDMDTALERSKANKMQEEIDEYATKHNVTDEDAKELIEKDKRIKQLEFDTNVRNHKDQAETKKKELANELYFKELEPDIDKLIQENIDKGQLIDVDTAYKYLLGTKAKELLADSKKVTEKRTIANIQDRAKRTVQKEAGSETQTVVISDEAKRMAREMGVDLKKLAKRLAKKKRSDK